MLRHVFVCLAIVQLISCDFILPTYRPPSQPKTPKIYRVRREANQDEPQWIYQGDDIERAPSTGDHPFLPQYIDDVKLDPETRYARSVDSPSARRGGGSGTRTNTGSRDTGRTHPGYNRRNTRSADHGEPLWIYKESAIPKAPATADYPFLHNYIDDIMLDQNQRYTRSIEPLDPLKFIKPFAPRTPFIRDWPRPLPIYAGSPRVVRDVHIAGVTDRKPSHRNVIIPNWNPNARIKPWQTIGVRHS